MQESQTFFHFLLTKTVFHAKVMGGFVLIAHTIFYGMPVLPYCSRQRSVYASPVQMCAIHGLSYANSNLACSLI